jgi:hypothetical protein
MGMDLDGEGGQFRFNVYQWSAVLALAQRNGWEPAGTVLEQDAGWSGRYDTNDGQTVTAGDAGGFADALERALPDIPDHDALEHKTTVVDLPGLGPTRLLDIEENVSPVELFSGDGKDHLRKFITYCRAGSFRIW